MHAAQEPITATPRLLILDATGVIGEIPVSPDTAGVAAKSAVVFLASGIPTCTGGTPLPTGTYRLITSAQISTQSAGPARSTVVSEPVPITIA